MKSDPKPNSLSRRQRIWIHTEDALIILSILSLWPTVFRIRTTAWMIVQSVALAILVVIMILRIRRVLIARGEAREKQGKDNVLR